MTIKITYKAPLSCEPRETYIETNAEDKIIEQTAEVVKADSTISSSKPELFKNLLIMKGFSCKDICTDKVFSF